MKIVVAHNYYLERGGEDGVFEAEAALLERHGHTVIRYTLHNNSIRSMSGPAAALATMWNHRSSRDFDRLLHAAKPDIVHFHNTFPLISPAAYYTAGRHRTPVVQTLHNYRLLCANALFYRHGQACEKCLDKSLKWPSVLHGCYRDSRTASAAVATMIWGHHFAGTWHRKVDAYIALTNFSRDKFLAAGFAADRLLVKPNFVEDPGPVAATEDRLNRGLFVGRFSAEKGIRFLIDAWRSIDVPLTMIGGGPLLANAGKDAPAVIELAGPRSHAAVIEAMQTSAFLVFPSECYENMSLAVLEAFASGLPVIAPRSGANPELVEDGVTGLLFEPRNAGDFQSKIAWAYANPGAVRVLGSNARAVYRSRYTPDRNHAFLIDIYRQVIARHRAEQPEHPEETLLPPMASAHRAWRAPRRQS